MLYYAGIGSRETPDHVLETMASAAQYLGKEGFTLRSGGAKGADTAFDQGATRTWTRRWTFSAACCLTRSSAGARSSATSTPLRDFRRCR